LALPLISKTIDILAGKTLSQLIPITVPKGTESHTLTITAQVNEASSTSFEEASIEVLMMDAPLTLTTQDSKVVINPGSCEPIDKTQQTVDIVIAGSSHLDVNNIDINTVEIIGDNADLIQAQIIDISTTSDKPCEQQKADGRSDLLLRFNLQQILATNNNAEFGNIYLSILYFTKTGMRYTHNGLLVFP